MLFNSFAFLLVFFPSVLAGERTLRNRPRARLWFLTLASLAFYGWWNVAYLVLIAASVGVNYALGVRLSRRPSRAWLVTGLVLNLGLLGYFKYTDFLFGSINAVAATQLPLLEIVLPLAISFFTFQQIAFLVDANRGLATDRDLLRYTLFVTFFPQLIAGPIVHHTEVMPQFDAENDRARRRTDFTAGLTLFIIGLAKKVIIADTIAGYSDAVFAAAAVGAPLTGADGWLGTLAYTAQLYFDFSGYTDMAIGAGLMLGIRLPFNFNSPYKARSVIDFWRRWHMTLSRFLRDYLYIPLGGSRRGPNRRYTNLMVTMLIGGLWHGAGWNFVIWGGLHGFYLLINHLWRSERRPSFRFSGVASWASTFVAVSVAWVFFRARNIDTALRILAAMARPFEGLSFLPEPSTIEVMVSAMIGGSSRPVFAVLAVTISLGIALFAPNSQQLVGLAERSNPTIAWRPTLGWGLATGSVAAVALLALQSNSPFLYFQF